MATSVSQGQLLDGHQAVVLLISLNHLMELGAKFVKICEDNKNYSGHKYLSTFVMNL